MPKNLVTGDDARDVAAYVASAVAKTHAAGGAASAPAPTPSTTPPQSTPAETTPAPATSNTAQLAAGKKVFTSSGCAACHTLKDAGASGTAGPDLDKVGADAKTAGMALAAYVQESIVDPNAYVVPGFSKGVMPPDFKTTLTAQQISDVVAYIVAVAGK